MKALYVFALSLFAIAPGFANAAQRCAVNPEGFSVDKSESAFHLNYRGTPLYTIRASTLAHPIYGGNGIDLGCGTVNSSTDLIVWTLGWKKDLLIAFGVIRENGQVTGISRLVWFPHDGTFSPLVVHPNHEIQIQHGRKGDLASRICWNSANDLKWRFSFRRGGPKVPEPCNPDPAATTYGAKSRIITVGAPYVEAELGG